MQVRPEQLQQSLTSGLKPAYVVSGDEPLQVMESLDAIRAACREQGFDERDVFDISKDFDWAFFQDTAASMSLFSERKILECRMPSGKPGREGSAALKAYLERPPQENVLVISTGKLDGPSKNSAWYKAADKAGVTVHCWPIQNARLDDWLRQRFAARGMQVDGQVLAFMRERIEGNLLAANQEIEKLYMLIGPGSVDLVRLQEAVSDNSRYSMFELVDTALQGDLPKLHKIVDSLVAEGAQPIMVNWTLARDIRTLTTVAGRPVADGVLMKSGVWKSRLGLFRSALERHRPELFRSLLARCSRVDQVSKGVLPGDPWSEILTVAVTLASRSA